MTRFSPRTKPYDDQLVGAIARLLDERGEHEEAEPLCLYETFPEDDECAQHRHGRSELDEHLRRTG